MASVISKCQTNRRENARHAVVSDWHQVRRTKRGNAGIVDGSSAHATVFFFFPKQSERAKITLARIQDADYKNGRFSK